jgi:hypothetical protein
MKRRGCGPWIALAENLGAFAGQLTETSIAGIEIIYEGTAATSETRALTQACGMRIAEAGAVGSEHGECARSSPRSAASAFPKCGAISKALMKATSRFP